MSEDVEKYVVSLKLEGLAAELKVTIGKAVAVITSPCPPAVVPLVLTGSVTLDFVIMYPMDSSLLTLGSVILETSSP